MVWCSTLYVLFFHHLLMTFIHLIKEIHSPWFDRKDASPIVDGCKCYTCQNHTKAYINHLFNVHEMLAQTLLEMYASLCTLFASSSRNQNYCNCGGILCYFPDTTHTTTWDSFVPLEKPLRMESLSNSGKVLLAVDVLLLLPWVPWVAFVFKVATYPGNIPPFVHVFFVSSRVVKRLMMRISCTHLQGDKLPMLRGGRGKWFSSNWEFVAHASPENLVRASFSYFSPLLIVIHELSHLGA